MQISEKRHRTDIYSFPPKIHSDSTSSNQILANNAQSSSVQRYLNAHKITVVIVSNTSNCKACESNACYCWYRRVVVSPYRKQPNVLKISHMAKIRLLESWTRASDVIGSDVQNSSLDTWLQTVRKGFTELQKHRFGFPFLNTVSYQFSDFVLTQASRGKITFSSAIINTEYTRVFSEFSSFKKELPSHLSSQVDNLLKRAFTHAFIEYLVMNGKKRAISHFIPDYGEFAVMTSIFYDKSYELYINKIQPKSLPEYRYLKHLKQTGSCDIMSLEEASAYIKNGMQLARINSCIGNAKLSQNIQKLIFELNSAVSVITDKSQPYLLSSDSLYSHKYLPVFCENIAQKYNCLIFSTIEKLISDFLLKNLSFIRTFFPFDSEYVKCYISNEIRMLVDVSNSEWIYASVYSQIVQDLKFLNSLLPSAHGSIFYSTTSHEVLGTGVCFSVMLRWAICDQRHPQLDEQSLFSLCYEEKVLPRDRYLQAMYVVSSYYKRKNNNYNPMSIENLIQKLVFTEEVRKHFQIQHVKVAFIHYIDTFSPSDENTIISQIRNAYAQDRSSNGVFIITLNRVDDPGHAVYIRYDPNGGGKAVFRIGDINMLYFDASTDDATLISNHEQKFFKTLFYVIFNQYIHKTYLSLVRLSLFQDS